MKLRRWSLALITVLSASACASRRVDVARNQAVQAEALTDAATIRARCEDPDGVLAGRALCVLKDIPRTPESAPALR